MRTSATGKSENTDKLSIEYSLQSHRPLVTLDSLILVHWQQIQTSNFSSL